MDGKNKKTHFVYRKGEQIGPYEIVQALDQTGFQDIYLGQLLLQGLQIAC